MSVKPVLTKQDFVRRYRRGEFGNNSPTWDSVEEFYSALVDRGALYHLRNREKGGPTEYNVPWDKVNEKLYYYVQAGARVSDFYVSAMCPTEKTTFQGEVMRRPQGGITKGPQGLYVYGSTVPKPIRQSLLENGKCYHQLQALNMLSYYMNSNSLDWLYHLLDTYDGHVVEFTCLSTNWGTLPHYNTLFWECRKY